MSGLLVVLSSPSGGGKTTVINEILKHNDQKFEYSTSATTRQPRPGEINGKDYSFLSEQEFLAKVRQGEFLEWEQVHQFYYGTPKDRIDQLLKEGKTVLLDIDVMGGLNIKKLYPENAITVFIEPPSLEKLIERLKNRQSESPQEIDKRLKRIPLEMKMKYQYDYIVINDKLKTTVERVIEIINKY